MKRVLKQYLNNPQPIIQRATIMANTKYQFTPTATKDGVTIVMNYKGATKHITPENLTDKDAEHILNTPGLNKAYGHNIQLKKGADAPVDEEPAEDDPEELTATRSDYETLTGNKPGNRKLSTLRAEIAAFKKAE
jgi:hypothetical protein